MYVIRNPYTLAEIESNEAEIPRTSTIDARDHATANLPDYFKKPPRPYVSDCTEMLQALDATLPFARLPSATLIMSPTRYLSGPYPPVFIYGWHVDPELIFEYAKAHKLMPDILKAAAKAASTDDDTDTDDEDDGDNEDDEPDLMTYWEVVWPKMLEVFGEANPSSRVQPSEAPTRLLTTLIPLADEQELNGKMLKGMVITMYTSYTLRERPSDETMRHLDAMVRQLYAPRDPALGWYIDATAYAWNFWQR